MWEIASTSDDEEEKEDNDNDDDMMIRERMAVTLSLNISELTFLHSLWLA